MANTPESVNGTTQQQAKGQNQQDPHIDDYMVKATHILKSWLEAFNRTASLAGFPAQIPQGVLMLFPMALSIVNTEMNSMFHAMMLEGMQELLERTRATNGGLDPRAIQEEMERRRIAIAMGDDPEILRRLVMESNAVQGQQDRQIASLLGRLKQAEDSVRILHEGALRADGTEKDWTELREGLETLLHYIAPEPKRETVGVGDEL